MAAMVASAAGAAVLLVGWRGVEGPSRAALLELRVARAPALVQRQPPSPYVEHPTRGLEYSQGQLPFDVGSVPGSKSICDWVYCPTSSEAIQVSRWTPGEERAGAADPREMNDYAVTWTGWDYGTYGDVTNVYEPPDCIVKHLGKRTEPPKPCAVPGRKQEEVHFVRERVVQRCWTGSCIYTTMRQLCHSLATLIHAWACARARLLSYMLLCWTRRHIC
jgi:hypothetical protein